MKKIVNFLFVLVFITSCSITNKGGENTKRQPQMSEEDSMNYNYYFVEGKKKMLYNDVEAAAGIFANCLNINAKGDAAMFELANIYVIQKDYSAAKQLMINAVDIEPQNFWYRLLLAELYNITEETDEALQIFDNLANENQQNTDLQFRLAEMYVANEMYKEALEIYNQLENQQGVTEEVVFAKNNVYMKMENKLMVYQELQKLIDAYPNEYRYSGLLAEYYVSQGDYDKASELFNKLLEKDPDNGLLLLSQANYYRIKEDKVKALETLKRAFAATDIDVQQKLPALLNDGYLNTEEETAKNEIYELLNILIETHPNEPTPHALYADFLLKDENLTEAQKQLAIVVEINKDDLGSWLQLLYVELELEMYAEMLIHSNQAVELYPNQPEIFLMNGIAAFQTNDYQKAQTMLEMGADITFETQLKYQFFIYLGETYNKLKKYEKSDKAFDNALKINSQNEYVLNNYSYYLAVRGENIQKAKEMSSWCVEKFPENPTFLDTYAWVLYKDQNFGEALRYIEKAINHSTQIDADVWEHYGDILFKNNKIDEAVVQWQKALDAGSENPILQQKISNKSLME